MIVKTSEIVEDTTTLRCFAVNLPHDVARRESILQEFARIHLPFEFIEAVDGRKLTALEIETVYAGSKARQEFRELSHSEIGCALSHLSIYQTIVREKIPYAFIVEDDAKFNNELVPVLKALCKLVPSQEAHVVLLSHVEHYSRRHPIPLIKGHALMQTASRHTWLAHGYFITLEAARKMMAALFPVWLPADHWRRFEQENMATIRLLVPYCVGLSALAADSNLEQDRRTKITRSQSKQQWFKKSIASVGKLLWPFQKISRQKKTW